jgi:hypothetical protein
MNLLYELRFSGEVDEILNLVMVQLISPHLDSVIHPAQSATIQIPAEESTADKTSFVLDSFQIESILDYLRAQSEIRAVLEPHLVHDRQEWGAGDSGDDDDIWQEIDFLYLAPEERRVRTAQQLADLKTAMPDVNFEQVSAEAGHPEMRSSFTVTLKTAWDDEHERWLQFRDGKFIKMTTE